MDPVALTVLLIIAGTKDEAEIRQKLAEARKAKFEVHVASTFADAFKKAVDRSFDIFLADIAVSDCDGMRSLQKLIAVAREAPVVTITSVHDEAQAFDSIDGTPHPASECPLTRMLRSAKSFIAISIRQYSLIRLLRDDMYVHCRRVLQKSVDPAHVTQLLPSFRRRSSKNHLRDVLIPHELCGSARYVITL